MADSRRYLLPSERLAIEKRRHWAVLAGLTLQSLLLLVIGLLLARFSAGSGFMQALLVYFSLFVVARWFWAVTDWYVERLIVTDKRVLLITGLVARRVAIMPLVKVTDLTYKRSATGIILGYGEFVFESAGQDQALSHINFIPNPEKLYMQISELLFGGDKGAPGALGSPAELQAELAAGRRALRRGRFAAWRRRRPRPAAPVTPDEAPTSRIDDLLAHRDTLLADREDRFEREQYGAAQFDDDPEPDRYGSEQGIAYPPRPDSTEDLPRIHEPRRDTGRSGTQFGGRPTDGPGPGPRASPPRPRPARDEPPRGPLVDPSDD